MDKLIPISITKAYVSDIRLTFDDKSSKLHICVNMELRTDDGEKITEVSFMSNHWQVGNQLPVPSSIIPLAGRIREACEIECIRKVNGRRLALTGR
jgi:hypothetical protein